MRARRPGSSERGEISRGHSAAAGDQVLQTDRIIVATGSDLAGLPIDGLAGAGQWTNREATHRSRPARQHHRAGRRGDRRRARPVLRPPRHEGHARRGSSTGCSRSASWPARRSSTRGSTCSSARRSSAFSVRTTGESSLCPMRARSLPSRERLRPAGRPRVVGIGLEELGIEPTETAAPPPRHGRLKLQRSSSPSAAATGTP